MANVTATTAPPKKPLLFADSMFDDERTDAFESMNLSWDPSYVPGYSEARRANEQREARGEAMIPIPRLLWVRVAHTDGRMVSATNEGMLNYLKLGYRACGLSDLEAQGWGKPPTATVGPDGLIRRGDLALFIVGEERAERNRAALKRLNAEVVENDEPEGRTGAVYRDRKREQKVSGSLRELAQIELPD